MQSLDGENLLISNDFILTKPDSTCNCSDNEDFSEDFQHLFLKGEETIILDDEYDPYEENSVSNLTSSLLNLSIDSYDGYSINNEEELQEFIGNHKNFLLADGSASNNINVKCNIGIRIQGRLNGEYISVGYTNFLKRICTAPRAECVAICMALLIAVRENVSDLVVINDCSYIIEAIRNSS